MTQEKKIKVLIVEDSPTMLELLKNIVSSQPKLEIAGTVQDGLKVMEQIKQKKPHAILMDCFLPGIDGIALTKKIMELNPIPVVIVSSFITDNERALAVEALAAGAIAALEKPSITQPDTFNEKSREIIKYLIYANEIKLVTRRVKTDKKKNLQSPPAIISQIDHRDIDIIVMGASTGGPQILTYILKQLPPSYPIPIIVVQHISPNFVTYFVEQINDECRLNAIIAEEKMTPKHGNIYFSPPNKHILLKSKKIGLSDDSPLHHVKPSVDYLFNSAAQQFGSHTIGILLTGMGIDGSQGLLKIKKAGGITIAQNKESSVVFGMPGEAVKIGAASHILSPEEIVDFLVNLTK